jgi:hypothetical protein
MYTVKEREIRLGACVSITWFLLQMAVQGDGFPFDSGLSRANLFKCKFFLNLFLQLASPNTYVVCIYFTARETGKARIYLVAIW